MVRFATAEVKAPTATSASEKLKRDLHKMDGFPGMDPREGIRPKDKWKKNDRDRLSSAISNTGTGSMSPAGFYLGNHNISQNRYKGLRGSRGPHAYEKMDQTGSKGIFQDSHLGSP